MLQTRLAGSRGAAPLARLAARLSPATRCSSARPFSSTHARGLFGSAPFVPPDEGLRMRLATPVDPSADSRSKIEGASLLSVSATRADPLPARSMAIRDGSRACIGAVRDGCSCGRRSRRRPQDGPALLREKVVRLGRLQAARQYDCAQSVEHPRVVCRRERYGDRSHGQRVIRLDQ